jgi:hypothetical protein
MPFMSRYRLSNSIPFGLAAIRSTGPCEASHSAASRITFGYFSAHQRKKAGTPTAMRRGRGVRTARWRVAPPPAERRGSQQRAHTGLWRGRKLRRGESYLRRAGLGYGG